MAQGQCNSFRCGRLNHTYNGLTCLVGTNTSCSWNRNFLEGLHLDSHWVFAFFLLRLQEPHSDAWVLAWPLLYKWLHFSAPLFFHRNSLSILAPLFGPLLISVAHYFPLSSRQESSVYKPFTNWHAVIRQELYCHMNNQLIVRAAAAPR